MIERWKLKIPRDKSSINFQVLHQETFDKFGYYPEEISHASSKEIAWSCLDCKSVNYCREKELKNGKKCLSCAQRIRTQNRNQQMKEQGLAPNGVALGTRNKDGYREKKRLWRKKWRSTPIGCLTNRLRVSLKRVHKGYSAKNLPYTAEEYTAHVLERLEARNYICPLCNIVPIDYNTCDIDHVIPLSSAQTPEEALTLFNLANLDVLCPNCNQFIKADSILTY